MKVSEYTKALHSRAVDNDGDPDASVNPFHVRSGARVDPIDKEDNSFVVTIGRDVFRVSVERVGRIETRMVPSNDL